MVEKRQVYRCEICGNIVEVLHDGVGELVCCGKQMSFQEEKIDDKGKEKHVPVIEKTESGIKIKAGSVEHPMEKEHYIQWIEVTVNDRFFKKFFVPNNKPEIELCCQPGKISARAYCNVHGLWKN